MKINNLKPATYHPQPSRGFTLVEMLVSISVFMVVMTVAAGSLLSIIDANGKAQSLKSAVNNLNFAIESMAKEIRVGTGYNHDGCSSSSNNYSCIGFTSSKGDNIKYIYNSSNRDIERCVNTNTCQRMTALGVSIDSLNFYFNKVSIDGNELGRILITVNGTAGTKQKLITTFNLQTTVSQRSF